LYFDAAKPFPFQSGLHPWRRESVRQRKERSLSDDKQAKVAELQRLVLETKAESTSEDGAVRVVAAPNGVVKEIDLRMSAFSLSGVELGEQITSMVKAATAKADRTMSDEIGRMMADAFNGIEEAGR
jgi:DNA-binding protein YbaB